MEENRPKVGIGVLVIKDGKALMKKRKGAIGEGLWGGTGGHLEHMESFADCAKRETMEEAGIKIDNVRFLCLTNFKTHAPKHYVDIGLVADYVSGELTNMEPEKCDEIGWFDLDKLPSPLFAHMENYFKVYNGEDDAEQYFDA